jgi:hypothetical protein
MLFTVDSAKQFLLAKVKNRAEHGGVPVDDIEQRMFLGNVRERRFHCK